MALRIDDDLPPGVPPVTYAPREPRLRRPPFLAIAIAIVAVVGSWVPLVLFARGRVSKSELPRVQLPQDMGTQPKYREQQTNELFVDGRADRPRVVGTVARGKLNEDDHLYRGYTMTQTGGQGGKPQVKFFDDFPEQVKVDQHLMDRGRERYTIYCSACHGDDGYGAGSFAEGSARPTVNFDRAYFKRRDPEQVRSAIWHMLDTKRPAMPHFRSTLTEAEARAVIDFLRYAE